MRDLGNYQRQTIMRLIIGGIVILFVVGNGLIYLIYGPAAAISGMVCMGLGMIPLAAIFIFFLIIEWVLRRYKNE